PNKFGAEHQEVPWGALWATENGVVSGGGNSFATRCRGNLLRPNGSLWTRPHARIPPDRPDARVESWKDFVTFSADFSGPVWAPPPHACLRRALVMEIACSAA